MAVTMGRMHSKGKGISRSSKPYRRSAPSWLKVSSGEVVDQITKMAKKGLTPSQIGVTLRDSHGISQVKSVTGSKILRILKTQGECPTILVPRPHPALCLGCSCKGDDEPTEFARQSENDED